MRKEIIKAPKLVTMGVLMLKSNSGNGVFTISKDQADKNKFKETRNKRHPKQKVILFTDGII